MKYAFAQVAFGLGATALVARDTTQCYQLTAAEGAEGVLLGQLSDGQNRYGGNHPAGCYCLNDGGFTDSKGSGCIITKETSQFQCDAGKAPTKGFAVDKTNAVTYNDNSRWVACPVNDKGEYNVYSTVPNGLTNCITISLKPAGSCGANPASSKAASSTKVAQSSAPAGYPVGSSAVPVASQSGYPVGEAPKPSQSGYPVGEAPKPSQSGYPVGEAPRPSQSGIPGGCNPAHPGSCATPSAGVPVASQSGYPVASTVPAPSKASETPCESSYAASKPAPSKPASYPTAPAPSKAPETLYSTLVVSKASTKPAAVPSYPAASKPAGSAPAPSHPAASSAGYPVASKPAPVASSVKPSAPASSNCPTNLNGDYQYPHLIVPVSSEQPNRAHGTSYFSSINSTTCSIFNFDIPASYAGKTCSLMFLFPKKEDLETSDFTFAGQGSIEVSELKSPVTEQTTWANKPAKSFGFPGFAAQPGNSYPIRSQACGAGETVSFELCGTGSLDLNYFQDWNPSPIGLFVRSC